MMTNLHARSTPTCAGKSAESPPQVVPASARPPVYGVHPVHAVHKYPLLLLLGAWTFFGIWSLPLGASSPSFPSRPSVEQSETSAFSLQHLAFLAEVPAPSASALGSWLISATAALSILALGKQFIRKTPLEAEFLTKKEFNDFREKVDTNFTSLRDRIDHSHQTLSNKLDTMNDRIADVRSSVDRVDERTKHPRKP